jgi:pentatricopeptide repeat protein
MSPKYHHVHHLVSHVHGFSPSWFLTVMVSLAACVSWWQVEPDSFAYRGAMEACAKAGDWERALSLLDDMTSVRRRPLAYDKRPLGRVQEGSCDRKAGVVVCMVGCVMCLPWTLTLRWAATPLGFLLRPASCMPESKS